MKILFLHRNFPGQFRYLAPYLAKDSNNEVVFITNAHNGQIPGVKKYEYNLKREVPANCHRYLRFYEECIIHGQSSAEIALQLKNSGFYPDIIYGHTWGQTLFMKDVFPKSKLVGYFEWFFNSENSYLDFGNREVNIDERAKYRIDNSQLYVDLNICDAGLCPTNYQVKQFPLLYRDKIKVLHDGIDTDFCIRKDDASLKIPDKNIILTKNDEVLTYGTRGMDPYRGFPEFMRAVEILQKKRPNMHVIISGKDRVCYGPPLPNGKTYKQKMLEELDLDLNRIHFTGLLPFDNFIDMLNISSAHVYLTYPFVCSWSLLNAMACETPIIASNTEPVLEFLENDKNALLCDFFDVEEQVAKIEYALDNRDKMEPLRKAARKTIVDNYALKDLLPQHIAYLKSLLD